MIYRHIYRILRASYCQSSIGIRDEGAPETAIENIFVSFGGEKLCPPKEENNVSMGYERALEASKAFDNVLVVDSGHLSSGMGLMVLCAAEYATEGMDAEVIVRELKSLRKQVRTSFIVSNTEYLARSGRISENVNKLCQALMLHPVITLKKSSMKVGAIHVGRRHHVWKKYIFSALSTLHEMDKKTLFITYAGLTNKELKEIERLVKSKVSFENIIYQKASPAISTNCGPGTFGLLFLLKN